MDKDFMQWADVLPYASDAGILDDLWYHMSREDRMWLARLHMGRHLRMSMTAAVMYASTAYPASGN